MKACVNGFNPFYEKDAPSYEQIQSIPGYAVVEFGAAWCSHCNVALPVIREAFSDLTLPHIKVFDGKGKRLGRLFKVTLWPTLILLHSDGDRGGEEVARLVRPVSLDEVNCFLAHIET